MVVIINMRRIILIGVMWVNLSRSAIAHHQGGINITDYCPKMRNCPEGSHVMCMYYDPNNKWGPHCYKPYENVTMTTEIANDLLDLINGLRSKVALGKELGKNRKPLPKAYGMNRLKWDNELATYAQLTVNQCILKHDFCRATKLFKDPGQTLSRARYTFPDWNSIIDIDFATKGLTSEKINYAVTRTVMYWYQSKESVDAEMIVNAPDFAAKDAKFSHYLKMINGPSTHMGCGIASYVESVRFDKHPSLLYNTINIVCNYSARPKAGSLVYNVTPSYPSSQSCGCPPGTIEDNDCLCNESSNDFHQCKMVDSKTSPFIVLPIFSYKNDPETELTKTDRLSNHNRMKTPKRFQESHGEKLVETFLKETENERTPQFSNKKSNFINQPQFKLHGRNRDKNYSVMNSKNRSIKTDVVPRKDFSQISKIVDAYLQSKKKIQNYHDTNFDQKNKRVFNNFYLSGRKISNNNATYDKEENRKIEDDNKITFLLDNLEQEVDHAELDVSKKIMLDTKLRKIYASVIGDGHSIRTQQNIDNDDNIKLHFTEESTKTSQQRDQFTAQEKLNENKQLFERRQYLLTVHNHKYRDGKFSNEKEYNSFENDKKMLKSIINRNLYLNDDIYDDPLNYERRKFYGDKIYAILQKLNAMENKRDSNFRRSILSRNKKNEKNNKEQNLQQSTAKTWFDPVYVPDRARFLLGY